MPLKCINNNQKEFSLAKSNDNIHHIAAFASWMLCICCCVSQKHCKSMFMTLQAMCWHHVHCYLSRQYTRWLLLLATRQHLCMLHMKYRMLHSTNYLQIDERSTSKQIVKCTTQFSSADKYVTSDKSCLVNGLLHVRTCRDGCIECIFKIYTVECAWCVFAQPVHLFSQSYIYSKEFL